MRTKIFERSLLATGGSLYIRTIRKSSYNDADECFTVDARILANMLGSRLEATWTTVCFTISNNNLDTNYGITVVGKPTARRWRICEF